MKRRPTSDPVDSDLGYQSPDTVADGLNHMGLCYPGMIFDTFSLVLPVPNSDLFLPIYSYRLTVAHPGILIWSCDFLGGKSEYG